MLSALLTRGRLLAGVAALTLAGTLVAGTAFAETPTPTPTKPANSAFQTFVQTLAQKLGKSDADVQTAIAQTQQDLIDQAVKSGKISQAVADRLHARLQNGPLPFSPVPYARVAKAVRARVVVGVLGHELQAAATFLGLTPAQVRDQLKAGKSLAEIAQAQGKSRDYLKTALVNDVQSQLKQRVDKGQLTQAQADQALNRFKANVDKLIDAKRGARPSKGRPTPSTTPTPSATPTA